ncbi:MAG: nucleoside deaminase [Geobacteraceae bacterium]|nr:nucleoside deaminase [Geobacteraceae bacterium]
MDSAAGYLETLRIRPSTLQRHDYNESMQAMTQRQPNVIEISLPEWINDFLLGFPEHISALQDRMSLVVEAARFNVSRGTGGPFAAAVFEAESGKLVSLGVNLVTSGDMSMLHAEILALSLAQKKTGGYDLGRHNLPVYELVTSTEPCAMCFGAILWSGVRRLIIGARSADAERIGFDEGPKKRNWKSEMAARGIAVICDVERKEAVKVLRDYGMSGGKIYNSQHGKR